MNDTQALHQDRIAVELQTEECQGEERCAHPADNARALVAVQVTGQRVANLSEVERKRRIHQVYTYILSLRPKNAIDWLKTGTSPPAVDDDESDARSPHEAVLPERER